MLLPEKSTIETNKKSNRILSNPPIVQSTTYIPIHDLKTLDITKLKSLPSLCGWWHHSFRFCISILLYGYFYSSTTGTSNSTSIECVKFIFENFFRREELVECQNYAVRSSTSHAKYLSCLYCTFRSIVQF